MPTLEETREALDLANGVFAAILARLPTDIHPEPPTIPWRIAALAHESFSAVRQGVAVAPGAQVKVTLAGPGLAT